RSCGYLTWLRTLRTVLRAALLTVVHTGCIQCTTNDVVTYPWKVFHPATSDQYDRVFLKVVTFTRNVSVNFLLVRQTHTSYFPQSRVRLLRSSSVNTCTYTTTLRTGIQCRRLRIVL